MSLNNLLNEINISKGQFYYWFEDKADLFLTVLKQASDASNQITIEIGQPSAPNHFWTHITSYIRANNEWWSNNHQHIGVYSRAMELPKSHPIITRLEELYLPSQNHFKNSLEIGIEWDFVRSDIPLDGLMELMENVGFAFDSYNIKFFNELKENYMVPQKGLFDTILRLKIKTIRTLLETTK